ncbi:hypothetical protein OT109_17665 [Phycisphaeraceae bacterium D3-23]
MARARSNGGAYAWALVVFGCGFVVALLVAIIFYTKIEQANNAKETAEQRLGTYVNLSQDTDALAPWVGDESRGNQSAFRLMQNEILRYREDVQAWEAQIALLKRQNSEADATLARNLETIAAREDALQRQQVEAQAVLEEAQTQARGIEAQLRSLTEERDALEQTVREAMQNADASSRTQIAALNDEIAALENEANDNDSTIRAQAQYIADLEKIKNELIFPDVTTADGEILSVFNSGGQLFINRGRKQGVLLGLTFEVFDANEVIQLSEIGAPRGKATIEVYDLQDDTATCRVVRRSRGAQIVEGDVIANIVYDPNKVFTFYVFGDFDIEYNGGPNDIGRIQNLVTEWGGLLAELEIDEDELPVLSPQIDFLILGQTPIFPDETDSLDPEDIRVWQAQVREYEAYQALLDDAKRMRIPVLNQNRFIDLVGYYER